MAMGRLSPLGLLVPLLVLLCHLSIPSPCTASVSAASARRLPRVHIQQGGLDSPGTPLLLDVDPAIDCPLKRFAAQFSAYVQPAAWPHASNWTEELVTAMNLTKLCQLTAKDIPPPPFRRPSTLPPSVSASPACDWTRYVDSRAGENSNDGSMARPWKDPMYALAQSRTRMNTHVRVCIFLRAGYYSVGDLQQQMGRPYESQLGALALTSVDSNLTLSAYSNEAVFVSGATELTGLSWSVYRQTDSGPIMQATLPNNIAVDWDHFNELYVDEWRAIRAKFPNGDPFLTSKLTEPTGYISGASAWIAPEPPAVPATEIHVSQPLPVSPFFPQFQIGLQGTVKDFDPPHSYWAIAKPPGGGGVTYVKPRGFVWKETFSPRVANWSNPTSGRIFTFHGRGWGSWQFEIAAVYADNQTVMFGAGGFQEARGAETGGLMYVHNILEELDDANEWFVDSSTRTLYYLSNGTMPRRFFASQVPCILSLHGSLQSPVTAVTVSGLTFTHTPNTFLRPYEAPSGGDYAIHRGAALFLQGTQSVLIVNCTFHQLGSNAMVISNFNGNTTVAYNQFRWLGESAIILAGSSDGVDGISNRNQPVNSHIEGNLARDFSAYVKQGDAIFESITRSSIWAGNMAYNSPRSLFNKNDGFAGGLEVYQNLLFNSNKETSDHGPINTWDRQPYLTDENGQGPSFTAKTNRIHNNFLVNDYGSDFTIDHDDGSAFYEDSLNFNLYSGTKSYLGHSKVNDHQLFVYPDLHYGPYCQNDATSNYDEPWSSNRCILDHTVVPYAIGGCNPKNISTMSPHQHNEIYTPTGTAMFRCGTENLTLTEWQTLGMDVGTVVRKTPLVGQIIDWGSQLMFLNSGRYVDVEDGKWDL